VDKIDEHELQVRIERELRHHGGTLPPATNAAWRGYLAACIEWGLIEPGTHGRLLDMLPPLDQDPSVGILLGYEDSSGPTG
jgi:hypothetical protein